MLSAFNPQTSDFMTKFNEFPLHEDILKAVEHAGYTQPTKVQEDTISLVLGGGDVRVSAQTGSGKTAAFLLPAIHKLTSPSTGKGKGPRVLVLVPTRELATQVAAQSEKYSRYLKKVKTVQVYGGVPYGKQIPKLARGCDVLIATPGRLIDLMDQKKVDFSRTEMVILDEADRMLDMGFMAPVEKIVGATPKSRQTLLFSATLKGQVLKLSKNLLNNPTDIIVHSEKEKHENIEQRLHYVDDLHHKNRLLDHILEQHEVYSSIIFTSTKRHANQLVTELKEKGHLVAGLHGDMNQRQRTRTLTQMKNGKVATLVATDVAARGIDVQQITHVINFDLPRNIEDYVHRIGRTGRAGATGTALSFAASGKDGPLVREIEKFTGQPISVHEIEGLEPKPKAPKSKRGGKGPKKGPNKGFKSAGKKSFPPRRKFAQAKKKSGPPQQKTRRKSR